MKYKTGTKIEWKWLGRPIIGTVIKVYTEPVTEVIKGKKIKRNGSAENPAYLVESEAGNLALKLGTELHPHTQRKKSLWDDPKLLKKSKD